MVREKIRASQLVNRLEDHVLSEDGPKLDSSQVAAALGLLKKCVPDLSAQQVDIGNADGQPFKTERVERVIVDPKEG
jgi:exosome complex RNA-binding protein Rrp42 (RNase PH superfamily)